MSSAYKIRTALAPSLDTLLFNIFTLATHRDALFQLETKYSLMKHKAYNLSQILAQYRGVWPLT